jgi:hypothetical protein
VLLLHNFRCLLLLLLLLLAPLVLHRWLVLALDLW